MVKKALFALLITCFIGGLSSYEARAATPAARTVVLLYDSRIIEDVDYMRNHRVLEMPLNHLGLKVVHHDINKGLPNLANQPDILGVLTWFNAQHPIDNKAAYSKWVRDVISKHKKKFVIIGPTGLGEDKDDVLHLLGLDYVACTPSKTVECGWSDRIESASYGVFDREMVGLEWKLDERIYPYNYYLPVSKKVKPYLTLQPFEDARSQTVLISTHPNGGLIDGDHVNDYMHYSFYEKKDGKEIDDKAWIINPFLYFAEAFGLKGRPIPDTTTLSGNRIYFSHIDGDGWNNVSLIPSYRDTKPTLSAEVLLKELIAPYTDMPVTMALIGGDIDLEWHGTQESRDIASQMLALPQVQVGVHTHTHPFAWHFYEHYTKERELPFLHRYWKGSWAGDRPPKMPDDYNYGIEEYYYVPRAYADEPFDIDLEVEGAKSRIEALAGDKPATILMWSGNCTPFEEAVEKSYAAGMLNINGGDSRLDEFYPSYSWVAPIGRLAGNQQQIYAVNSNENTYTDGWQKPFLGFSKLQETWKNTESPIRIRGMNLYYHTYSAEHVTGLREVKSNLDYARSQEITPITARDYSALALGFYAVQFEPAGKQRWRVKSRGELQTIRFDDAQDRFVDFAGSKGVIGQRHHQGSLYVALDANIEEPLIALSYKKPKKQKQHYLISSRWKIDSVITHDGVMQFKAKGFGDGVMRWQMARAGAYTVQSTGGDRLNVQTDEQGILSFTLKADAINGQTVQISKR